MNFKNTLAAAFASFGQKRVKLTEATVWKKDGEVVFHDVTSSPLQKGDNPTVRSSLLTYADGVISETKTCVMTSKGAQAFLKTAQPRTLPDGPWNAKPFSPEQIRNLKLN